MASFPVRTFLRIIFFILNGIVVVGLLLASAAPLLPPSSFSLAAFCGLLFEPLFWTNIICALLWLFTHHKRYSLFSLCAAALAIVPFRITYSHSFRQLPGDETAQHSLTLLTYNTHQCQNAKKTPQNDVLQYVKESGADIVFLQEYEVRKAGNALTFAEAKDFLTEVYPYTYFDFSIYNNRRQYGLAVFSRYPLENKRTIRYESRANISDLCDVIVGADTFRLFNNHLESNRFTSNDFEGLTDERPTGSSIWRSFERLTSKMRAAYSSRAEEVKRVQEEIAASPYPVIIAGDKNHGSAMESEFPNKSGYANTSNPEHESNSYKPAFSVIVVSQNAPTPPTPNELNYNGTNQALVTEGGCRTVFLPVHASHPDTPIASETNNSAGYSA